jgi:response regulator of citrate/malate metabolism
MHLGVIDFLIKPFAYERFQVALEKFMIKEEAFRAANQTIDQSYVDSLISNQGAGRQAETELPKGIQKKTLDLLTDYLKEKKGWVSGDQISEDVGLSSVTVRHYMSYLVEKGEVNGEINYETDGRPSMLYRFVL